MTTKNTAIADEIDRMQTKVRCALGGPMTDADRAHVERFGELLGVARKVKALGAAVPFEVIARKRAELANQGAFGDADRTPWADRDPVERTVATQHVYEVLVAALAARRGGGHSAHRVAVPVLRHQQRAGQEHLPQLRPHPRRERAAGGG